MTRNTDLAPSDTTQPQRLSGKLGAGASMLMVVAAAAPLTIIGGVAPIGFLLGNGLGFPGLYVISAVVLLLFAVGLSAMSRRVPRPGAFFTYIGYGLSRSWGLGAAFLAILSYTGVQVAVFAFIGATLESSLTALGLPVVPWWIWSAVAVAIVAILGYRRIELSSRVLGILLIAEVAIVLVLDVAVIASGGAEGLSLAPFEPANVFSGNLGVGLMFAVAGFVGFEATAVFRDEAKDPARTVPRATYLAVIVIGVFYALSSWALAMAWGPSGIVDAAAADPAGLLFITMVDYVGPLSGIIVQVLLVTSLLACVLAFHNVISRYLHTMGSAALLPASLGRRHDRHGSPHRASLVQTALSGGLLAIFTLIGLDPVTEIFTWFSGTSTLGVLVLMVLTCLAVVVYFRRSKADARPWQTIVAPLLAFLGLAAMTVVVILNFPMLVGGSNEVAIAIGAVLLGGFVAGLVIAQIVRRRDPASYTRLTEAISEE
jgi:amino acid transporter